MGVLMMAGTAVLMLLLAAGTTLAWVSGRKMASAALVGVAGLVTAGYGALLLHDSLRSEQVVLPPGVAKRFCGFYLDCHLGVAVESVRLVPRIGGLEPAGVFAVVTLRIESNAVRATLRPSGLNVQLDAAGSRLVRSSRAESAWREAGGDAGAGSIERAIEAGSSYVTDVVFELPSVSTLEGPRPALLRVTEGHPLNRLVELFVIGDEDSFLHAPTMLALPRPATGVASG